MAEGRRRNSGKNRRRTVKKIIIILLLLLLAVGIGLAVYLWNKNLTSQYDSYEVIYTGSLTTNAATTYLPYSGGYLKITRDGAEAVNSYGSQIWNVTYNMNDPIAAVNGDYAVVGDCGQKTLYMMDGTGSVFAHNVRYPICEVETAGLGVAAVRMSDGMNDYIQLIDLSGAVLVEIKTVETKDGFPVDIALSEDGTKLVTSYLVMDGEEAEGWLTCYNFGDVGQNYANNLTGVFKYDTILPQVHFMDNDTVCAFTEDGAMLYSIPELPTFISKVTCENTILQAAYNEDYVALVTDNTKNGTKARVQVYNTDGKLTFDRTYIEEFSAVTFSGKDIIFYNSSACLILRLQGSTKFNASFDSLNVNTVFPVNETDRFLLLGDSTATTIHLVHTKE